MKNTDHPNLFLGLDCGGSKTTALLGDNSGNILGRGRAAGANFQIMPKSTVRGNLRQAVNLAFASASLQPGQVKGICVGMAGADRPEDKAIIDRWLKEEAFAENQLVTNDGSLLLWAGTPEGWGLGVISGTGSIVIGRSPQGMEARAGGWGHILGDEGSGYALGRAALQRVAQAADGILPETLLSPLILDFWNLKTPQDLISKIYQQNTSRHEIAALAPLFKTALEKEDEAACQILDQAALDLSATIRAVHLRLKLEAEIPAAFGGGILISFPYLVEKIKQNLLRENICLSPLTFVKEPAQGALRLAKQTFDS